MSEPHGTTTGYAQGCRCAECRAARAEYQRKVRWLAKERLELLRRERAAVGWRP